MPNFEIKLKTELKEFQKTTADWMEKHEKKFDGGIISNEPGLGKTLNLLNLVVNNPKVTLIVCPAGLVDNWMNEIKKHTTLCRLKTHKYYGPNRVFNVKDPFTLIYITSYTTISSEFKYNTFDKTSLFSKVKFERIVLDEGHCIRNTNTSISKSVLFLGSVNTNAKKWIMTATPVYNNINDVFSYFKFLEFEGIDNKSEWTKSITKNINGLHKLNEWMHKYSIAMKKENVLKELKTKKEEKVVLQFKDTECEFYECLRNYSFVRMKALVNRIDKLKGASSDPQMKKLLQASVMVYILRLKQACNSPYLILKNMERLKQSENLSEAIEKLKFFNESKKTEDECPVCYDTVADHIAECGHKCCKGCWDRILVISSSCPSCREFVDSVEPVKNTVENVKKIVSIEDIQDNAKIEKVLSLTRSALMKNEKIVIVSQWVSYLDIIRKVFEKELPNIKYIKLQGSVPLKTRTILIKDFESNPEIQVCFLSLTSSSEGITLVSANHLVFMDSWWNKSKMIQASDRIHRIGQLKQVYIYFLSIGGTIEEKIEQLLEKKEKMSNLILNKWKIADKEKYDDSWMKKVVQLLEPQQEQSI
jgi:SNF2 family DNA or RNA helicase